MRPNVLSPLTRQRGSMLIISVFAITALAALGAALLKINASQSDTTAREVLGARAWLAANSGTEMAMAKLFPLASDVNHPPVATCSATPVVTHFSAKGLYGCSVSVTCEQVNTGGMLQYRIESKGQCGNGAYKVARVQESWARGIGS
ncbi:MSHA biogenesis protein MshP [Grimontia hollisae]|uniref:MSHA biogenesis protein MshP n=1 Tax=Grimontia hollisae TaxID=673 RepID=UPI00165EB6F2|nr:MSHA biogenesis protein MshP [Grimontia hollisae]